MQAALQTFHVILIERVGRVQTDEVAARIVRHESLGEVEIPRRELSLHHECATETDLLEPLTREAEARVLVAEIGDKLLANPVIEEYALVRIEA